MSLFTPAPAPTSELARYRILGPSCGLRVSPFALGGASLGESWNQIMGSMSREDSHKLLDRFYELGGNFIDVANVYQDEQSETIVGDWMKKHNNRDEMVVATKYTTSYKQHDDNVKIKVNHQGNHIKSLHMSVDASLKKLQTSYIDILFLHWWDHTTSIPEIMQGLNNLVRSGKVLYLGVSDTPAWIVAAANEYARAHAMAPFVVYQGKYSVFERDMERDILPMARHFGMGVITWNSVGGGMLQTRQQMEERAARGEGLRKLFGNGEQSPIHVKASQALEKVANELGTKSITAVALAYVMQKNPYLLPIVGGRKIEHLEANVEALSLTLTDAHFKFLEDELPFDVGFPNNFVGMKAPNVLMASVANYALAPEEKAIKPSDYKK